MVVGLLIQGSYSRHGGESAFAGTMGMLEFPSYSRDGGWSCAGACPLPHSRQISFALLVMIVLLRSRWQHTWGACFETVAPVALDSVDVVTVQYGRRSLDTGQLFKTWRRVCFCWDNGHVGIPFLFQRWRLELCGSMSTAAFKANFICSSGNDCTAEVQMAAHLGCML